MNLAADGWIPVIGTDGQTRLASLADVFRDGETIADLAANPCQRIALMRLLICIAQAALDGPADEAEWRECRQRMAPAALAYLDQWQDRFNLFGEHAFLQVDGVEASDNSLADKIDISMATGNNPTLFDHHATPSGRVPLPSKLALDLLVYQSFSPGGLIGSIPWNGVETGRTSEHAPCIEGSMLHTLLRAAKLVDTIYLNLQTKVQIQSLPNAEWGCPFWTLDHYDQESLASCVQSYLGRLARISRVIRCQAQSPTLTLGCGIRYAKLPEWREPMATAVLFGKGNAQHLGYVAVSPSKHPWRELGAVLSLASADQPGGPMALAHIRGIQQEYFDIWTGGIAADKSKLLDMGEWTFSLPSALLDTYALDQYQEGVALASGCSFALRTGLKKAAEVMKSQCSWNDEAQRRYWTALDRVSGVLANLAVSAEQDLKLAWEAEIRVAMRQAYAQCCPHETPRQIEAYAQGLKVLEGWKP